MTTKIALLAAVALLAAPAALAGKPQAPGTTNSNGVKTLTAKLRGANGMRGNVDIRLNASKKSVCWAFSNLKLNGKKAFAAHVHTKAGGGIVIPLGATPLVRRGCTTNADWATTINAVISTPSGYYVNVHEEAGLAALVTGVLKKGMPTA